MNRRRQPQGFTVADLLEALRECDPDLRVFVQDYWGEEPVTLITPGHQADDEMVVLIEGTPENP